MVVLDPQPEILDRTVPTFRTSVRLLVRDARIRWLLHAGWVLGLSAWAVARVGRFGFHPTDQGFVLAQSWRVLHGEIPHRDIISARPLGSALVHTVDFLLPGPLFLMSSVVTMLEIVIAAIALAALLTSRPVLRWGPLLTGLVAASALINLHTFPVTAWHTVDGIFLTACGWWALDSGLRSGRPLTRRTGLLLLGFATLCKQSFALAPLTGLIVVLAPRKRGRATDIVLDLLCLIAFPLAYLGLVSAGGGLPDAITQLTGAQGVWFDRMFTIWDGALLTRPELPLLAIGFAAMAGLHQFRRRFPIAQHAMLAVVVLTAVLDVSVLADGRLRGTDPPVVLLWGFLFAIALRAYTDRRLPWRLLAIALLAWMASLSWGYDTPALLGGTMVLGTLWVLVKQLPEYRFQRVSGRTDLRPEAAVLGLVAVLVAGQFVVNAHDAGPYRDRPQGELLTNLGDVTPSMAGIRTNPATHEYLAEIGDCVRQHPAKSVAVLPDNAFVYPALGLRNPFPLDWPLALELVGDAHSRILDTVQKLNRDGGFLVLFQTTNVPRALPLPPATVDSAIVHYSDLEWAIFTELNGRHITCGSFVGVWSP
jgi:hypothetical protein